MNCTLFTVQDQSWDESILDDEIDLTCLDSVDISRCRPPRKRRKRRKRSSEENGKRLRRERSAVTDATELTPMAAAMVADLVARKVAVHRAPCGSGKTHSALQAAVCMARSGERVLIAFPTVLGCGAAVGGLREMAPDLAGNVQLVSARKRVDDEEAATDSGRGRYEIGEETKIVVTTHAQLGRRDWSCYVGGLFAAIRPKDSDEDFRPFHIIIDEDGEYLTRSRREVPLRHRAVLRGVPDGSRQLLSPTRKCPMRAGWANCGRCELRRNGGGTRWNKYGRREPPEPVTVEIDRDGNRLSRPADPLKVSRGDIPVGDQIQVGPNTWVRPVLVEPGWREADISTLTGEGGTIPEETSEEILDHLLQCGFRSSVTTNRAVGPEGGIIKSSDLKRAIEKDHKKWREGVRFPVDACEVPVLRLVDMVGLEAIRRYREEYGVGVLFLGATPVCDDDDILRAAYDDIEFRVHPYPERKIDQLAIVATSLSQAALIGPDGRLATAGLESFGKVVVFCGTKKKAHELYWAVSDKHGTARLVDENDEYDYVPVRGHVAASNDGMLPQTWIAYGRSVLAKGVNIAGLRTVVLDCAAFRPLSSFTPQNLSMEEYQADRTQERIGLLIQCAGRLLRGEEGKLACLILLNADEDIVRALTASETVRQGAVKPPILVQRDNLPIAVAECREWLSAGGGEWPSLANDPGVLENTRKRAGRPKTDLDIVISRARAAGAEGVKWRKFAKRWHLERFEISDQLRIRNAYEGTT